MNPSPPSLPPDYHYIGVQGFDELADWADTLKPWETFHHFLLEQGPDPNPEAFFTERMPMIALNKIACNIEPNLLWDMFFLRPMTRTDENPLHRQFMKIPTFLSTTSPDNHYVGPLIQFLDGPFSFLAYNVWIEVRESLVTDWEQQQHKRPFLKVQFFDPEITMRADLSAPIRLFYAQRPHLRRRFPSHDLRFVSRTRIECRGWCLVNCGPRWKSSTPLFMVGPLRPTRDPHTRFCIFGRASPLHLVVHPTLDAHMTPVDNPSYAGSAAVFDLAWAYLWWKRTMADDAHLHAHGDRQILPIHRIERMGRRFHRSFCRFQDLVQEMDVCERRAREARAEKRPRSAPTSFSFDGSFLDLWARESLREQDYANFIRWEEDANHDVHASWRVLGSDEPPLRGHFFRRNVGDALLVFDPRIMFVLTPDDTLRVQEWALARLEHDEDQIEIFTDAKIQCSEEGFANCLLRYLHCSQGPFPSLRQTTNVEEIPPHPSLPSSSPLPSASSSPWDFHG